MRRTSLKITAVLLIYAGDGFKNLTSDLLWGAFPNTFPTPIKINFDPCALMAIVLLDSFISS